MKRHLVLTLTVALLLSACSGAPNPDTSDVSMDKNTEANDAALGSDSYSLDQTSINSTKDPMNSTVKSSVSDFKAVEGTEATLTTTKGDIVITLYRDKTPVTVANFLDLASTGFYDGVVFHRVIPDFMAQVGDPLSKDASKQAVWGTGGPGYTIIDEFNPELKHDSAGVLSMANTGQPSTGGSQFFITFEPTPWLDGKHTVFGKVTQGLDVLEKIQQGDKITAISIK